MIVARYDKELKKYISLDIDNCNLIDINYINVATEDEKSEIQNCFIEFGFEDPWSRVVINDGELFEDWWKEIYKQYNKWHSLKYLEKFFERIKRASRSIKKGENL